MTSTSSYRARDRWPSWALTFAVAAAGLAWAVVPQFGRNPCKQMTQPALIFLALGVACCSMVVALVSKRRSAMVFAAVAVLPFALSTFHVIARFWDATRCGS